MYSVCIQSSTKDILILIEKFLYIINDRYSEVMCAKYDISRMNDVLTVCPADFVGLPGMANHILFEKESDFCMAFVLAIGQPTWESAHELYLILEHLN